jgi:hypothetical protein
MELPQKPLVLQVIAAFFLCTGLAACADVSVPWLTGEPGEDVTGPTANYPGIQRTSQQGSEWPNLGQVPDGPGAVTPIATYEQQMDKLQEDHTSATAIHQRYLELHGMAQPPVVVPPTAAPIIPAPPKGITVPKLPPATSTSGKP